MAPKADPEHLPFFHGNDGENFDAYFMKLKYHFAGSVDITDDDLSADKKKLLFAALVKTLHGSAMDTILNTSSEDGAEALKALRDKYAGKTQRRMSTIHVDLFSREWQPTDTVDKLESDYKTARRQLTAMGDHAQVSNTILYSLLISKISAVPMFSSLASFARGEDNKVPETTTADKFFSDKLDNLFEQMRSTFNRAATAAEGTAMAATAKPVFRNKKGFCTFCKIPGHTTDVCRKLKAKKEKDGASAANAAQWGEQDPLEG